MWAQLLTKRCCTHIATILIQGRIAVAPVVKITAFQSTCNAVLVVHKQRNLFGTMNILLIHRPKVLRDVGAVVEFEGWYRNRTIRQGMGRQPTTNGLQDVSRPIKSSNSSAQFLVEAQQLGIQLLSQIYLPPYQIMLWERPYRTIVKMLTATCRFTWGKVRCVSSSSWL